MQRPDIDAIFRAFSGIHAGVVGDVMLDTYLWGHVDRISPEAPVPVVRVDRREHRIGGAGNVALNLAALGAATHIFSVTGKDADGDLLSRMLAEKRIDAGGILRSPKRITTNKTRVISRNQQMLRMDSEMTEDLSQEEADKLLLAVRRYLEGREPRVMILEDYNKGVLTEGVITSVIQACNKNNVIVAVDPKRRHFFAYRGVDIFKPNLKEVREGLGLAEVGIDAASLEAVHAALLQRLSHHISFITLSEHGVFFCDGERSRIIPTHVRNIADVSGAGDTVIAVAALAYAATRDMALAAEMANIAGGLVCEEVGTAAIDLQRLREECKRLLG